MRAAAVVKKSAPIIDMRQMKHRLKEEIANGKIHSALLVISSCRYSADGAQGTFTEPLMMSASFRMAANRRGFPLPFLPQTILISSSGKGLFTLRRESARHNHLQLVDPMGRRSWHLRRKCVMIRS